MQHRLERGDFPVDLDALTQHSLFGFAKHRLRPDLCDVVLRKVGDGSAPSLAEIAALLGEADRAVLPRNVAFLVKIGALRLGPPR
jgi:hypothetical protein